MSNARWLRKRGSHRANGASRSRSSPVLASASQSASERPSISSLCSSSATPSGRSRRPIKSPVSSTVSRIAATRAAASSGSRCGPKRRPSVWSSRSTRPPGNTTAPGANRIAMERSTNSSWGWPRSSNSPKMTRVAAGIPDLAEFNGEQAFRLGLYVGLFHERVIAGMQLAVICRAGGLRPGAYRPSIIQPLG